MDRLSYKDGYLNGIYQSLNTLLKDGIISKKQWKDYKDKLFNENIIVPEKFQFFNRNYIKELKQIKNERKNYMQTIIPLIKEIEQKNIYIDYNFMNMNEMLIDGVGMAKSSASEILLLCDYYYNPDGSIKPEWKDFETKTLIFLARCHKKGMDIDGLRKSNSISPTMKFDEIKDFSNQFIDD